MFFLASTVVVGCGAPLPENPKTGMGKANPAMAEQRIKETMENPRFTDAQKAQIIATIKQRNHMN